MNLNDLREWARTTTEIVTASDGDPSIVYGRRDVLALLDAYAKAQRFTRWVADGHGDGLNHDAERADRDACWCVFCEAQRTVAACDALVTPESQEAVNDE